IESVHANGLHGTDLSTDERVRVCSQVIGVVPQIAPDTKHAPEVLVHDCRRERLEYHRTVIADMRETTEERVKIDRTRTQIPAVALTYMHVPKSLTADQNW